MGNRAVITASTERGKGIGIYVHWNGGPASVLAFLDAAKDRGFRDPGCDQVYGMARLCGLICEFFGNDGLSVGIGELQTLDCDNYDNGVYVIGKGWEIVDRYGEGSDNVMEVGQLSVQQFEQYRGIRDELATEKHQEVA